MISGSRTIGSTTLLAAQVYAQKQQVPKNRNRHEPFTNNKIQPIFPVLLTKIRRFSAAPSLIHILSKKEPKSNVVARQIAANLATPSSPTGPRTEAGKTACSKNVITSVSSPPPTSYSRVKNPSTPPSVKI